MMMMLIEYINVFSQGKWQNSLSRHQIGQYFFAAFLGVIPGCLGAFAIVSMYTHRLISFGAVVSAMIATSGDESFAMLSLNPKDALTLLGILFVTGVAGGPVADRITGRRNQTEKTICSDYGSHLTGNCKCFPPAKTVFNQWKRCTGIRRIFCCIVLILLTFHLFGIIGPSSWGGVRIALLGITLLALFIVVTVPDHLLKVYFWERVFQKQSLKIFLWTFGTLTVLFLLSHNFFLEEKLRGTQWAGMIIASLVGLIPQSGPHYIFTTLYLRDLIPFNVLLANSIVQDGHGLLPMLSHSRKTFFEIKFINLIIGLLVGTAVMVAGR